MFIRVDWLQSHHTKRIEIVERRKRAAQSANMRLSKDEQGENEPTILEKANGNKIRSLMRQQLHWHPFKAGRKHQFPGDLLTSRNIWLWQAKAMHDFCCSLGEGYAWEYLWNNWYKWEGWKLWARSADLEHYPVIQTNAVVEAHWTVVKSHGLKWYNRPRVDHLCATIQEQLLPLFKVANAQVRIGIKPAGWYKHMITEWRNILKTIRAEDRVDELSDADARTKRMDELHHTDIESWNCTCADFMTSAYHICRHLVRQFGNMYPGKGECFRQRTPPLLFISGLHDPQQREAIVNPSYDEPEPQDAYSSLQDIGVTQADLELLESTFPQQMGDEDDSHSADAMRYRQFEEFNEQLLAIVAYNKEVMSGHHPSHRHFRELPPPSLSHVKKFWEIAEGAKKLKRKRTVVGTFSKERRGNIFLDN